MVLQSVEFVTCTERSVVFSSVPSFSFMRENPEMFRDRRGFKIKTKRLT